MRYAIIKQGVVVNIILWDHEKNPNYISDGSLIKINDTDQVSIGWNYEEGEFINPNQAITEIHQP
ncbi:hypothetical protein EBQ81_04135 [bacterium]|nr:hypothetical protein [bacterium]NDC24326.1 hypothetical protein [Pseudomonadota bacterium]